MPLPIAPLIMAGSQLAGGIINSVSQGSQNRRSRRFATEQYQRERADNLSFWQQQNEYNSPTNQISRLKKAGLNPALMYGGSASGASGQAGPLKAPSSQSPQFKSSRPGDSLAGAGLTYMNALYDLDIKKQTAQNLKTQNTVQLQDAALRAAQVAQTTVSTDRSKFDLGLASELRKTSADAARQNLRNMKTNRQLALAKNEREAIQFEPNLQLAIQKVLNMREQTAQVRQAKLNAQKDGTLKQYQIELRKLGIEPGGPFWAPIVGRLITQYLDTLSSQQ